MAHQYNEDLFDDTKMTFGEHLEELRSSLFKALLVLVLGFSVGLFAGPAVVRLIQEPVVAALDRYHVKRSMRQIEEKLASEGKPIPSDEELKSMATRTKMVPEQVYVDPQELVQALRSKGLLHDENVSLQPEPASDAGSQAASDPPESDAAGAVPPVESLVSISLYKEIAPTYESRMITLSTYEAFMIYIKAALVFGAIIASPFIFYFVWSFVAAGLYPHEKRYVHVFLPFSIILFLAGATLAFTVVFKYVLDFLFDFNLMLNLQPELRISEWVGFVLLLPLGFGVSFQLPLVMLFLERIGVFTVAGYLDKWRLAVLTISVISMLLTPADPMSMLLMAVPLTVLYFGGIALCRFWPRRENPFGEAAA